LKRLVEQAWRLQRRLQRLLFKAGGARVEIALPELYDDGGFTGANMDRPVLTRLLRAAEAGRSAG
jgi:DNA invertase Pin-like site-specific DNA recombinase